MTLFLEDDLNIIIDAELLDKGVVNDTSGNVFLSSGIQEIMCKTFKIESKFINERDRTDVDKLIEYFSLRVVIKNVNLKPPTTTNFITSQQDILLPKTALLEDKTYSSALYADMDIYLNAYLKDGTVMERKDTEKELLISMVPIPVKSILCNTYNKSIETLVELQEDPFDIGGYFIIKGNEWVINSIESTTYNVPKIFKNKSLEKRGEFARLEIISKPGDAFENNTFLKIRLLTNYQLVCVIARAPFDTLQIPFFLLFRLLGWSTDKQIVDWIAHNYSTEISKYIIDKINRSFHVKYTGFEDILSIYNTDDILKLISTKIQGNYYHSKYEKDPIKKISDDFMKTGVDNYLLPHIGSNDKFRHEKAIYLAYLIRQLFLVDMGVLKSSDRDSYRNKRAHSTGIAYAKSFKTQFHLVIVQPIKKQFQKDCKSTSFDRINLRQTLRSAINSTDFERALSQAITTGSKQQIRLKMGVKLVNRLISQQMHRKSELNVISTMRQVNTPNASKSSKQSSRAKDMRKVHPSYLGYICSIQTQEGMSCGINKQLAITASITQASSSVLLAGLIKEDPDLIPLNKIDVSMLNLAVVKVNGHWIGSVKTSYTFVDKYRKKRRQGILNKYTTIYWDCQTDEIRFWTDTGRIVRPLLIVNNNGDENNFSQGLALTVKHMDKLKRREITIQDLVKDQVVEYISSTEQENILLASSYNILMENKNNPLKQFTHCDIPCAILGFSSLTCPMGTHSPASRVIKGVHQSKQCCGWFSNNWPYRIDKNAYHQYNIEIPLVRTLTNNYIRPNGLNCIVAVQCYTGYNMEDSVIINKAAVQRGMFDLVHMTFEKSELDKNESFMTPDVQLTSDIKPYANYGKLYDGFPKRGTTIVKNDVIIGKVIKNSKNDSTSKKYMDRSVVFKHDYTAKVMNVIVSRNQDGKLFAKVQLMIVREVVIGDKFSMRSGQKGVICLMANEEEMPFTASGFSPDVIFNPFSLPSRMTVNTVLEVLFAKVCAIKGITTDGTMFKHFNFDKIQDELKALGFNRSGVEKLYNGQNGKAIDYEIFIGPAYYQRLQKFANKQFQASSYGSTDAITRQPLQGKASNGGLRLGYMEKDAMSANGISRFLSEKMYDHSNRFKVYICRSCGGYSTVNIEQNRYKCNRCKDHAIIEEVDSSWTSKLFFQEIQTMNVGTKMELQEYKFEK